jgi:hypothetical protein
VNSTAAATDLCMVPQGRAPYVSPTANNFFIATNDRFSLKISHAFYFFSQFPNDVVFVFTLSLQARRMCTQFSIGLLNINCTIICSAFAVM